MARKSYKEKKMTRTECRINDSKRYSYMSTPQCCTDPKVRERWARSAFGDRWKEELAKRDAARRGTE